MESAIRLIQLLNKYINETEFWNKKSDDISPIIGTACEALKICGILFYPILPSYCSSLFELFCLKQSDVKLKNCIIKLKKGQKIEINLKAKPKVYLKRITKKQ